MSYEWSHKSVSPHDIISDIYCMKWNTAEPAYDWLVKLRDGDILPVSIGLLQTYPLTKHDMKGLLRYKQNLDTLRGHVRPHKMRWFVCFACG
jgi:hypothetical protein